MYTPNRTDKIRNNSIYSQPQDINVFSISEFSLEYICCWSYASNDLTPSCATTQVSLDSPQQYTYFNITATTVHISQHYRCNGTHTSTVQLQQYMHLNITATTLHTSQQYNYNFAMTCCFRSNMACMMPLGLSTGSYTSLFSPWTMFWGNFDKSSVK